MQELTLLYFPTHGTFPIMTTPSKKVDRTLTFLRHWAHFGGSQHKAWTIDQVVRILTDCEYDEKDKCPKDVDPSETYKEWVRQYEDGEDGPNTYTWVEGIQP